MADTSVQREVQDWIRNNWLPNNLGHHFYSEELPLSSGGVFGCGAVSEDKTIAVSISTSRYETATGKGGTGKMNKIRSDMYFLLLCNLKRRIIAFTVKRHV